MSKTFVAKVINNRPKVAKYPARYAPEVLANGLTTGIVDDQGNIVHGVFDEGENVDPFTDINSDKFVLLNSALRPSSPSPGDTSSE